MLLEPGWLKTEVAIERTPDKLEKIAEMDDPANMDELAEIGRIAAKKQVKRGAFPGRLRRQVIVHDVFDTAEPGILGGWTMSVNARFHRSALRHARRASISIEVEEKLIAPALEPAGIEGRTTGEITRQGNIREDMFRLLVLSDIVIADVSIYNANVFYELGIRHGLRDRHTLLIRAKGSKDKYPFDLQTDRYFQYDPAEPAEKLPGFLRP